MDRLTLESGVGEKPITIVDKIYIISHHEPRSTFLVNGSTTDESETAYLARTGQLSSDALNSMEVVPIDARQRLKNLMEKNSQTSSSL